MRIDAPSGRTLVAGVIGDPIAHSLSPAIHNAAFREAGLDWVFVAMPVPRGHAAGAVQGARDLGIRGLSVTMPHKEQVLDALDGLTSAASALGAVNCILRAPHDDSLLLGDNTDGAGFIRGLRADFDLDPAGTACVVLGAGGAGRAVAHALGSAGAGSVTVVNRDPVRGRLSAELAGGVGRFVPAGDPDVEQLVSSCDLLVNATPVGMGDRQGAPPSLPVEPSFLRKGLVLAELVYHPLESPLMSVGRERGVRVANGLSMLVHQAAVAFERWTGVDAPVAAMAAAVAPDPTA